MDWKLELRPLRIEDGEAVHGWAQLDKVCRYQAWGPNTPSQTQAFVAEAVRSWAEIPLTRMVHEIVVNGTVSERHRISGTCDPRNLASGRVMQHLGMTHEGRMRQNILLRDGWRDTDIYSILRTEWPPQPLSDLDSQAG